MSEIDEIRVKFESGQLDSIKVDLERFLIAHREDILRYRVEQETKGLAMTSEAAVKFYILRQRSVNPGRDIRDQLDEIQKEKWIRGVQSGSPPDAQAVAREWARSCSAGWRSHRVTTIIYVFERDKERYLKLLA